MSLLGTLFRRLLGRSPSMLPIGSQAPDFDLPAHDGSRARLADFAGKRVLLWFYPKADTPG
ncbi:MAG: hypothetical protein RL112_504 [Planctomycetota bacterium]|jgi:peroxiredoxin Q/BCP